MVHVLRFLNVAFVVNTALLSLGANAQPDNCRVFFGQIYDKSRPNGVTVDGKEKIAEFISKWADVADQVAASDLKLEEAKISASNNVKREAVGTVALAGVAAGTLMLGQDPNIMFTALPSAIGAVILYFGAKGSYAELEQLEMQHERLPATLDDTSIQVESGARKLLDRFSRGLTTQTFIISRVYPLGDDLERMVRCNLSLRALAKLVGVDRIEEAHAVLVNFFSVGDDIKQLELHLM